jgi:hypothetical protein
MAVCAFCGQTVAKTTKDHVPPRGLFGDTPGHNLITVPACAACNNSTSKDDEYFRLMSMEIDVSGHPVGQQVSEATLRSILHPKKGGFRKSVFRSLQPVELTTKSGLYVGKTFLMKLDAERILRIVGKIIRGLFYHHLGRPLPADYQVVCHTTNFVDRLWSDPASNPIRTVLVPWLFTQPSREIGSSGVFRYRWVNLPDAPNMTFFTLRFYDKVEFFGFTYRPSVELDPDAVDSDGNEGLSRTP